MASSEAAERNRPGRRRPRFLRRLATPRSDAGDCWGLLGAAGTGAGTGAGTFCRMWDADAAVVRVLHVSTV